MSSMPKEILKKYATNFEFYNQAKDRLDDKMSSRIGYQLKGASIYNREDWDRTMDFMITSMSSYEKVFKDRLSKIKDKLKSKKARAA